MQISFLDSVGDVKADLWQQIVGQDYPFARHEFLNALEASGSANSENGWQAQHLLVHDNNHQLIALMPLYLKEHSYGEYVFDWSWANAFHDYGQDYYPKLVSAIPFTPATGPRLAILESADKLAVSTLVANTLKQTAQHQHRSSVHILFPDQKESECWQQQAYLCRTGVQYHWFNKGYQTFDHFLEQFSSRKRKNLKKERRRIREQHIELEIKTGREIGSEQWDLFYHFYQTTYAKRSGHGGYLKREFFYRIGESMAEQVVLVLAKHGHQTVAGALYLRSDDTLYGRYWGCIKEFDLLHFETCYYQGIEFCIANGLKKFDPGAQGEHKIQRGFAPIKTYSNHWIADPQFRTAIANYLQRETMEINSYIQEMKDYLPFKQGS